MMWGPGVARAAADLVLDGRTDLVDVTELGLDRFDSEGRSRLAADPIALPFPQIHMKGRHDDDSARDRRRDAELEDWGPLDEATGAADDHVRASRSGSTVISPAASGSARPARRTGRSRPTR